MENGKRFRKEAKVVHSNYKSIAIRERNNPQV